MKNIILQGICYDEKSSFMKGTALAPAKIREAYHSEASNYFAENGMEINPEVFLDMGDFTIDEYFDIESITRLNLKEKLPLITLGGDHSISYPLLRAFHSKYGPLEILHLDAHADLYHEFEGDLYSHACPFARIMEKGLASKLVQVGIRTLSGHQREQAKKFGAEIIEMKDYTLKDIPKFKGPLYVSIDIDVLDPAFVPGISHYEPGGFSTRELLRIIQNISCPIVGADIVEYNPKRDYQGVTAMVCSKILKEVASGMISL